MTSAAIFFLAAGILTSVSILSVFQVLFSVSALYFTFLAIKNKATKLPASAYWLIAFSIIAFLSLVINLDLVPKPSKNFGRIKYFLFGVTGIYILRVWLREASLKTKKILTNTFLVSIIAAGTYACYQYLSGMPRAKGLTDTMRYGYGSGMLLLTVLSAILHREKIRSWFDYRIGAIALIIGFLGMYVTYTRGGLLAFICGLPVVMYFYRPKIAYALGVLALIAGGTLVYFNLYGNVGPGEGNRFLMTKNNNGDVIRRSQWKAAVIAIQEKPVLGYGLSNFHSQLKRIKTTYDLDAKEYDDAHAHNLFLEIAAGTGILGLIVFLGWIVTWVWEVLKQDLVVKALVIPFGAAWIISSQFEVTFDANNASMIFFLYALSVASLGKKV